MDGKMSIPTLSLFFFFCSLFLFISSHAQLLPVINDPQHIDNDGSTDQQIQTYIVHVERHEHHAILTNEELERYHMSFLPNATLASGEERLLASYRHVMSGFAAQLTRAELQSMESMPGFIHAFPDEPEPLDTTHTPEFLGLSQPDTGFWAKHNNQGEGIIIAVIDSGLAVNHPSFADDGMPQSPPEHWKTSNCSFDGICNKKVIGAVTFSRGKPHPDLAPQDMTNHGSSVASVAAGNFVANANVTRRANGTASGMAPRAHIAVYKACQEAKCNRTNKLAAGERAIEDGVDVIVISSGLENLKYYQSSTDMIALAAIQKDIVVCASAGNGGRIKTIKNGAPWVITVGASTTDRIVGTNKTRLAPKVAKFSSRGPSLVNGDILKPDILAPGRQILTARATTSESPTLFKFSYGTSFAAPHVGGIVALIRKERPSWTAAMIHSAIMTTADELDSSGNPMLDQKTNKTADVFATGAGQVNAMRALDPGLVYDVKPKDHLGYLCYMGYTEDDFKGRPIIERILKCKDHQPIRPSDLNYASMSATLNVNWPAETFRRTMTNVGAAAVAVYEAHVVEPEGVKVFVRPKMLQFTEIGEKKSFEVVVLLNGTEEGRTTAGGKLEWRSTDGKYVVKSPIAVAFYLKDG